MSLVIQVLEAYLNDAKAGKIKHLAISAAGQNNHSGYAFIGEQPYEELNLAAVSKMKDSLAARVESWRMPEPDPSLDASYVTYHLGASPNGFDFMTWLVSQEMRRVKAGAPGPLKVAFWIGKNQIKFPWLPVYRQMLGLVGAVEDEVAFGRFVKTENYLTLPIVELHREGISTPVLRPTKTYDIPKGVVTITLREVDYEPERNSDIPVWLRSARYLASRGEHVVIVRDTAKADEPFYEFETCPLASKDIDARMYLYANAKLNFFVSNGPCTMGWFSDRSVTFIHPEDETSAYNPNKPSFWRQMMGVEVGGQFPWFNPTQRIVWKRPDYKTIKDAYHDAIRTQGAVSCADEQPSSDG